MSTIKQFLLSFLICLAAFGTLSYFITVSVNERFFGEGESDDVSSDLSESSENPEQSITPSDTEKGFTALIIGKDDATSETDALILCRVDKEQKKLSVCSIPTDTRYEITGVDSDGNRYDGSVSFKETVKTYGTDYLIKKIYALTDQKVDYYVRMSGTAAKTIIGELAGENGILYTVPEKMDYDEDEGKGIHLNEGAQYLSGSKAVELLRYRTYKSGTDNTKRCTTQVDFLRKLVSSALSSENPLYTKLLSEKERERFLGYVTTNVTSNDIAEHLDLIFELSDYEFVSIPFRSHGVISAENVPTLHDTFNEPFDE